MVFFQACKHIQERVTSIIPAAVTLPSDFEINCSFAIIGNSASAGKFFSLAQRSDRCIVDPSPLWAAAVSQTVQWNEEGVDVIVGAHWSSISGPVALVAAVSQTLVISYWATAPSLSDKAVYRYFARTIPHDDFTTNALVNTIGSMGWKALALLYPDNIFGQGFAQGVAKYASDTGVTVLASQSYFPGDAKSIEDGLRLIKRSGQPPLHRL